MMNTWTSNGAAKPCLRPLPSFVTVLQATKSWMGASLAGQLYFIDGKNHLDTMTTFLCHKRM